MNAPITPVISEKAQAQAEAGVYLFNVPTTASKLAIASAVGSQFGVKVASVRTLSRAGKRKQTLIKRGRGRVNGQRSKQKKAFVTLAKGEKISLFEGSK